VLASALLLTAQSWEHSAADIAAAAEAAQHVVHSSHTTLLVAKLSQELAMTFCCGQARASTSLATRRRASAGRLGSTTCAADTGAGGLKPSSHIIAIC
jgi:hypothetical protein